ncbi:peptidase [Porphyromonas endodontalis]
MKKQTLRIMLLTLVAMVWVGAAQAQTEYDFSITDVRVTSANCGDLASAIPGVKKGSVKYDPTTQTLTLKDATIHAIEEGSIGIRTWMDGLNIQLIGENTITTEKGLGMANNDGCSLTIKGSGSLVIKGATAGIPDIQDGIHNRGSITVSGCTLEVSAGVHGLTGGHWKFGYCTVRAKGGNSEYGGSIAQVWYEKPEFAGCTITAPKGTYWKDFKVGGTTYYSLFGKEDKAVTNWVTIASEYNLQVGGVQVNSANYGDLAADNPNVTGTVQYDPTAKTLTLQDATIKAESKFAIESGIEGLKVKVVGTSKLTSENYTTLSFAKPATITGGGTLNVESSNDCAIYANKTSLTIEGCTVHATAPQHGIAGFNGASGEILTIRNATVSAEGKGEGSIHDFANVILEGCAITQPAGAAFNKSLHGVALNGQLVKSKVVITKGGTSIEGVTPNVPQKKRGIYNLEGIRLSGEWKDLPAGIYIVDGEKRIKE